MPTTSKPVPLDYRQGDDKPPEGVLGARHSRKRSAKGAKNTKAPMDAEGGCACTGGKKTSKCKSCQGKAMKDGGCGMKRDRADALSAPEYVAACELGIQSRSRTYIRTRLDFNTGEGQGKACGKGFTSKNNQCQKGPGSATGPRNYAAEMAEQSTIMKANDFNSWRKSNKLRTPTTQGSFDRQFKQYGTSKQGAAINAAWKKYKQLKEKRNRRNAGYAFLGGAATGLAALALSGSRRRRDATYAPGFKVDLDQLAI